MKEAFIKTVQDRFCFDLREKTKHFFLSYLLDNWLALTDVFEADIKQADIDQYVKEVAAVTGSECTEDMARLAICLDVLGKICKPMEPWTPEQMERIAQLRKKYASVISQGE
ncbi:MAG: hypothetical protein M0R80_01110 [Proteobacteria bacterium]|jgi:hypothetical protein|nr:hypothetical protein [Pseudomonadota bacterium]